MQEASLDGTFEGLSAIHSLFKPRNLRLDALDLLGCAFLELVQLNCTLGRVCCGLCRFSELLLDGCKPFVDVGEVVLCLGQILLLKVGRLKSNSVFGEREREREMS